MRPEGGMPLQVQFSERLCIISGTSTRVDVRPHTSQGVEWRLALEIEYLFYRFVEDGMVVCR